MNCCRSLPDRNSGAALGQTQADMCCGAWEPIAWSCLCIPRDCGGERTFVLLCRCPALAQVSLREESPPDYALARIIRQQGPEDKVLVAQSAGQLVGCMSVTSMVAVGPLQENFDLQIYDQLVQPDVYEAALAAHTQRNAGATVGKSVTEIMK